MKKLLIAIILLSSFLRLWHLGSIPPHLTSDEAALGYNAYSILKTGRDEYGTLLPIIFKSFGDWKPGLYIYITVPFVAVFGLNEFSVRLPGVLSGIIAVWLIFILVRETFIQQKETNHVLQTAATAGFILALNPWHVLFSRGAWEANMALTLTLGAIIAFLRAVRLNNKRWLFASSLLFALTLLTYQGAKLASGLVVLGLVILYVKELFKFSRKSLFISLFIGIIIIFPILLSIFTGRAGRLEVFSIFSYPRPQEVLQAILKQGNEHIGSFSYDLYHSETLSFARGILGRWMNHYSSRFLFFEGDWGNPRHSVPYSGMLLLGDIALLAVGFFALVRMKLTKGIIFIWYWLIVSPLPAALSRDSVHAVRAYNEVIPFAILLGIGGVKIFSWLKKHAGILGIIGGCIFYGAGFLYWVDQYFVHMPIHDAKYWEYGYKQTIQSLVPIQHNYNTVVFVQSYDQPYIYYLFYTKYDPRSYQKIAHLTPGPQGLADVGFVEQIDNIHFEWIDWPSHRGRRGVLFIGTPEQIPPTDSNDPKLFHLINEVKYPDGRTVFRLVEVL